MDRPFPRTTAKTHGAWDGLSKEVIAGYFLVAANDINEAVAIAKDNPIFKDISTKIEVHPMMPVGGN
jgi:hypothetical protein